MLTFKVVSNLSDLLKLDAITSEALSESRFRYFDFAPEKFEKMAREISKDSKRNGVLVCYSGSTAVGFVFCNISELAIARGALITTVTMFFVPQKYRDTLLGGKISNGLLSGLENWTRTRGGLEILFHANFGSVSERVHRFVKRRGFETVGGTYAKTLGAKTEGEQKRIKL
ncbi:hypothetical protein [Litoreibacter roseus]|uniref:N-acetyltransferase domain-containing protein n=1 Tax=Litoreibacter roseus TaxID=2601869 RepID=A0A6N6JHF9_9RHOB|nr:hypothetical protein [Litoreibacter roseus]GFE65554.1 hypothetical protein KIN_26280 [Litoreibacter roseus]